jgi:sterol desaturase/sphingolipid hydroxylase (fatty acid hydroxylase superfamily)
MTRKLQRRIVLAVLIVLTLCALSLVTSTIKLSYLDFSVDFIAKKYQGSWKYMLTDFFVYASILIGAAVYQGWDSSALKRILSKRSQTTVHDIGMWLLRTLYITEIFTFLITYGLAKKLRWYVRDAIDMDSQWLMNIDNIILQQFLFFIVLDFTFYWLHRLEHHVLFLWAFHKYHHSATEMNVINALRDHPFESEIFRSFMFALPFAVFGAPFSSFIIFQIIRKSLTAIQHSGLNWSWGWIGKYVLVSPRYHEIHHSKVREQHDSNFAGYFPLIDRAFGTYYDGKVQDITYGVEDDNHNNTSFLRALWIPFMESFEAIMVLIPRPGKGRQNPDDTKGDEEHFAT